jgi:hypothetical protein
VYEDLSCVFYLKKKSFFAFSNRAGCPHVSFAIRTDIITLNLAYICILNDIVYCDYYYVYPQQHANADSNNNDDSPADICIVDDSPIRFPKRGPQEYEKKYTHPAHPLVAAAPGARIYGPRNMEAAANFHNT